MKVAINKCIGGFRLSRKAVKRWAELQGRECYFFVDDIKEPFKFVPEVVPNPDAYASFWAFDIPNPNDLLDRVDGEFQKHKIDPSPPDEIRADPLLIQVIEELGEEANDDCADIHIIEIPDGIKWYIEDYNGPEIIHEEHRTWK